MPSAPSENNLYPEIVEDIRAMYNHQISEQQAREAAQNLINFCRVLLEMKREIGDN